MVNESTGEESARLTRVNEARKFIHRHQTKIMVGATAASLAVSLWPPGRAGAAALRLGSRAVLAFAPFIAKTPDSTYWSGVPSEKGAKFFTYVGETGEGELYPGHTADLARRMAQHTANDPSFNLLASRAHATREKAFGAEMAAKRLAKFMGRTVRHRAPGK